MKTKEVNLMYAIPDPPDHLKERFKNVFGLPFDLRKWEGMKDVVAKKLYKLKRWGSSQCLSEAESLAKTLGLLPK